MNYLLKSKPNKNINRNKIVTILVVFVLVSTVFYLFSNQIKGISRTVMMPLWLVRDAAFSPFLKIANHFSFKNHLIEKNTLLQEENATLRLRSFDYEVLQKENELLKNSLGRIDNNSLVFAKVLSKPPVSPYDTLVLDIGSEGGVSIGSPVYLSDNVIVGLVKNVTLNTSLVELFSSSSQVNELSVLRTGATFSIAGKGGGNLEIEVPKDTDIIWGDVFVYPGLKTSVLGTVHYIDSTSQGSFKTVYIRLFANIFEISSAFVLK